MIVIPREKIDEWKNAVHVGNFVMRRLREEGVPTSESLFPTRVEHGRIIIEEDAFGDLSVTWEP